MKHINPIRSDLNRWNQVKDAQSNQRSNNQLQVLFGMHVILFIYYPEKGKTVTREYYTALLEFTHSKEKRSFSPRQCTCTHIHESGVKIT